VKIPVILFTHARQIRQDQDRERPGKIGDDLDVATTDELADLPIDETPHEFLVPLEPHRRDQAHQQRAVGRVRRSVAVHEPIAVCHPGTAPFDLRADVVAFELERQAGKRPAGSIGRREPFVIAVHRERLVVAGYHHDAMMGFTNDGTLRPKLLEVRMRIVQERRIGEVVGDIDATHGVPAS